MAVFTPKNSVRAPHVSENILGCIGNTPLVRLGRFYRAGPEASIFAKLEYLNPGGSVKDRIASYMIADAERRGKLGPGGTIIEPTAGNTGIGPAFVPRRAGLAAAQLVDLLKWRYLFIPKPGPRQVLHHLLPLARWRMWLWEMIKQRQGFSLEIVVPSAAA